MKLKAKFSEKSMAEAKKGKYTFMVDPSMTKDQIKKLIGDAFGVKVITVRTMNKPKLTRRTMQGKTVTIPATKKAIVTLADKQKIDLFEEAAKEAKK